jgi:hypothetical protein
MTQADTCVSADDKLCKIGKKMIELAADELILQRIKEVAAAYFSVNDLQAVDPPYLMPSNLHNRRSISPGQCRMLSKKDLIPTNSYEEILCLRQAMMG